MKPKILIAVDGSTSSMKAVRYVGNIVSGCQGAVITLFHILPLPPALLEHGGAENPDDERRIEESLQGEVKSWAEKRSKSVEEEIFAPARQILKEKGFPEDAIMVKAKTEVDKPMDEAYAIIQEAKEGGYDTVVLGRRGRSKFKDFVFGSVTTKVIHAIKDCAIWIIE